MNYESKSELIVFEIQARLCLKESRLEMFFQKYNIKFVIKFKLESF